MLAGALWPTGSAPLVGCLKARKFANRIGTDCSKRMKFHIRGYFVTLNRFPASELPKKAAGKKKFFLGDHSALSARLGRS